MKSTQRLSVSILDIDILKIDKVMASLKKSGICNIHIDIIDTSFTENISFGLSTIKAFLGYNKEFNFSIHLMIENPIPITKRILESNEITESIQFMVHSHFEELLEIPRIQPVLAINPDQSIEDFDGIIHKFKDVLIMTVFPGFGGQKLILNSVDKIKKAKELGFKVTVDGGINEDNIELVCGADTIVIGSAIICSEDIEKTVISLSEKLQ